ncbi:MAG: histidine kinase [Actinomycetota bacterium]
MSWWLEDEVDFAGVGAAIGAAAGVLSIASTSGTTWIWLAIATVVVVARAFWRSMPPALLMLAPATMMMIADVTDDAKNGWFLVCVAVAVGVASTASRWVWLWVAIVASGPAALWIFDVGDYRAHGFWTWSLGLLLSAAFGAVLRRQRELITRLETTQQQLADAAAAEERSRIAHELHDVVGHSFSVVLLHLSGARRKLDSDPERAREALAEAESVGRKSMDDLRAALVLLRADDDEYAPVAGVDALPALIDEFRTAGLAVDFEMIGDVDSIDTASGVVLHGVAREALTNAAKHATTPVAVRLDVSDAPSLVVDNRVEPGVAVPTDRSTQGLDGMRRRVQAVGGRFDVAVVEGVWSVRAALSAPERMDERPDQPATERPERRGDATDEGIGDGASHDLIAKGSG